MGLDSLEAILAAEQHFGIELPEGEVEKISTFGDFLACVNRACIKEGKNIPLPEIEAALKAIIVKQVGGSPDNIRHDSHLLDDLGMD